MLCMQHYVIGCQHGGYRNALWVSQRASSLDVGICWDIFCTVVIFLTASNKLKMEEKGNLTRKRKAEIMYHDIRVFLYNKENGEVMGRNAESWGMW